MRNAAAAVLVVVVAGCAAPEPAGGPGSPRWEIVRIPANASLRGIAVVNARTVWASGSGGALWRTVDGGATWQNVAPADCTGCDFRDVEAITADQALAMVAGEPARVYRTADGGRTWQIVHADARRGAFFDALAFAGAFGLLFADPMDGAFQVWTSDDAGQTWRALPAADLPAPQAGEAAFAASGTCVAVSRGDGSARSWIATGGAARARVLIGERHGASWRAVDVPLRCGAPSRGGFGFAVAPGDERRVVLVGGDYTVPGQCDGTAAWSDDGGATWRAAAGGAGGYRSAAVWLEGLTVLAVGPTGTSCSDDGGRSWRGCSDVGFHAIARSHDGSVFACGSDGRVARWLPSR